MNFRMLAEALRQLADGLEDIPSTETRVSTDPDRVYPSDETRVSTDPDRVYPSDETRVSTDEHKPFPTEQQEDVELADLQKAAKDLIQSGKRDELREILSKFKLPNLSAANLKDYPKIMRALIK